MEDVSQVREGHLITGTAITDGNDEHRVLPCPVLIIVSKALNSLCSHIQRARLYRPVPQ